MSDLRKAAQQALEALESCGAEAYNYELVLDAENALYAALAQPEPEPVAWRYDEATYRPDDLRGRQWHFTLFSTRKPYADEMVQNVTPLYTAPPQRKPLSEATIDTFSRDKDGLPNSHLEFARAIEAAHGIGDEE